MKLLDRVCELWGRMLSPIETQKILSLSEEFSEEVILEAAMISSDKTYPMQYMCKILYYVKHPLEKKETKKEDIPEGSEWLKNFHKSEWGKEFKEEMKKN